MEVTREKTRGKPGRFGTFGGVFTPCTLTILGVIMFLRFGQVIGQAGVIYALLIVLISKVITLLTSLSLSAIATNTRVKGGGVYYLISRSLGVEFGGAIGVVFFLAQAISVSLYVIGFSEAFVDAFGPDRFSIRTVATVTNIAVFLCVFIGAGWTIKVQYFILAILAAAIASFSIGAGLAFDVGHLSRNLSPHYATGQDFFTMFALFFPAVTGIMAGANMSGDLRDPAKSIPRGTLAAVAVTTVVYLFQAVLLGSSRPYEALISSNMVIKEIAFSPLLITGGVFAATLSSALGSMMGAPRILQAFGRDDIFRSLRFFAPGSKDTNEPRRATVLTFVISQTCIALGDLNAIAPVITMAFMITYGTLNLATFYEAVTKNPSYRPRFRYCHWSLSLLGAISCIAVMFLIAPVWAGVSLVAMAGLHRYISRREIESRWGDLQSGVVFERTRQSLLRLEDHIYHPKNWRPIILALSGGAWTRPHLAVYGHWLSAGRGVLTLAQVIQGEVEELVERRENQEKLLRKFIRDEELQAFPAVIVAPYLSDGIESLVQCHGLGGLRPNTVLLGWASDANRAESFGSSLRLTTKLHRSIVCLRISEPEAEDADADDPWEVSPGPIDVWWRGMKNGELMLLLAHLLVQNSEWRTRPIRLLRIVETKDAWDEVRRHLEQLIVSARIEATPVVVLSDDVAGTIQETSRDAALVVLGFEAPEEGHEIEFYQRMESFIGDLERVILVDSAGDVALHS